MCTVLLPPGDNPITVNKYISINISTVNECVKVTNSWIVKWLSVWGKCFAHPCWNGVLL